MLHPNPIGHQSSGAPGRSGTARRQFPVRTRPAKDGFPMRGFHPFGAGPTFRFVNSPIEKCRGHPHPPSKAPDREMLGVWHRQTGKVPQALGRPAQHVGFETGKVGLVKPRTHDQCRLLQNTSYTYNEQIRNINVEIRNAVRHSASAADHSPKRGDFQTCNQFSRSTTICSGN